MTEGPREREMCFLGEGGAVSPIRPSPPATGFGGAQSAVSSSAANLDFGPFGLRRRSSVNKMPEFYVIIALKIFFPNFRGILTSVSYAYAFWGSQKRNHFKRSDINVSFMQLCSLLYNPKIAALHPQPRDQRRRRVKPAEIWQT